MVTSVEFVDEFRDSEPAGDGGWWGVPGAAPVENSASRLRTARGCGPSAESEFVSGAEQELPLDTAGEDVDAEGLRGVFGADSAGAQWPGRVPTRPSDPSSSDMASAALAQLEAGITSLLALDPTLLSSARLLSVLTDVETQTRRLPAIRHALVIEAEARGVPAAHGFRSTAALLRKVLRLGPGEAKAWVRDAERLSAQRALSSGEPLPAELPAVAAAQAAGLLSGEQLRLVTAAMHRLPTSLGAEDRAAAEQAFVALAADHDAKKLADVLERMLTHLDPDGTQERHRKARRLRGVTIGLPGPDGLSKISGWLTPLVREAMLAVLDTFSAPNPLHPENAATADDIPTDNPDAEAAAARTRAGRGDGDSGRSMEDADEPAMPTNERTGNSGDAAGGRRDQPSEGEDGGDESDVEPSADDESNGDTGRQAGSESAASRTNSQAQPTAGRPTIASAGKPDRFTADPATRGDTTSPPRQVPIGTQVRDLRSASQRLHDAMGEACERILATGTLPVHAGMPATILLVARLADLRAGYGTVETGHGGTIPIADAVRMAARAHIVPMVFDTDSSPLWTGRSRRLPTLAQRHTLVARDLGCTIPGCDMPAWRCQAHHSPAWAPRHPGDALGRTDIDAMGLLCGYDHHRIDDWTMTIHRGRAWWTPPPWIDVDQTPRTNTFFRPLTALDAPPPRPGKESAT